MPSQASSVAEKLSAIAASNSDLTIDERETCNHAALLLSETEQVNGALRGRGVADKGSVQYGDAPEQSTPSAIEACSQRHDPKEVVLMLNDSDSVGRALPLCIAAECIEQLMRELADAKRCHASDLEISRALNRIDDHFAPSSIAPREVLDIVKFEKAPCYRCGYSGHSYFQPSVHPCAKVYHRIKELMVELSDPLVAAERVFRLESNPSATKDSMTLRPEVRVFAEAMERKLRANDHKRSWRYCGMSYLIDRLHKEVKELVDCFPWNQKAVLDEAADVANFAMFIATKPIDDLLAAIDRKGET